MDDPLELSNPGASWQEITSIWQQHTITPADLRQHLTFTVTLNSPKAVGFTKSSFSGSSSSSPADSTRHNESTIEVVMTNMKQVLTGTALSLLSLTAAADGGAYAGIGAGQVTMKDSFEDVSIQGSDSAYKLFAGYRFNENFALEAAYVDAGAPSDTIYGISLWVDSRAVEFSAIGNFPVSQHLGFFLRGSLVSWGSTITAIDGYDVYFEDNSGTDLGWGLGMAAELTEHFSIRAELEGADMAGTDYRMITLSGVFHF
ncbi:MAG TPA: outer membrane beta-barrel protein [Steroidobacteraceae bacterium]|nr:outer membrane beta-barrel protein [Steroidobacteraceae bacterium]